MSPDPVPDVAGRDVLRPPVRDETIPEGRWAFDGDVADVFDDMLTRSIPQLDVMRQAVTDLATRFARPGTVVVDLGVSRGGGLAPIVEAVGPRCRYLGVDVSEPMLVAARERFHGTGVEIRHHDLRDGFPVGAGDASVILSVLTLQFTPIEHRLRILAGARRALVPGGALLLVEKVLGASADLDTAFVDLYYDRKRTLGYTQEQIDRKRLALEGVLVPVTVRMDEELLAGAGFREVDGFWRWCNFAGWVAIA